MSHWRCMHSGSKAIACGAGTVPANDTLRVKFRLGGFLFSGVGACSLGRAGKPASMPRRGGQKPRSPASTREERRLARLHTLGVGVQLGLRQSGAMQPVSLQHSLRKLCVGAQPRLALAAAARHNRSIDTDAQVRPCAARTSSLCAGHFQRYVA